jgi:chromosome segregation ATPase
MAKNGLTRDMEYRTLLCEIATSQQRVSQLTDSLVQMRQRIRETESHVTGLQHALRSPAEGPVTQGGELLGPRAVKEEARAEAKKRLAKAKADLPDLQKNLAAGEKRLAELYENLALAHKRRSELEAVIKGERDIRVAAAVSQAADAAPGREPYRAARQKLYRLQNRDIALDRELHLLFNPASKQENTETRGEQYRANETMPAEVPETGSKIKELLKEQRVLREALRLQEREVRDLQRKYGSELATALRPTLAALAQKISDSLDTLRSAGLEADQLVMVAAIEAGTSDTFQTVRCLCVPADYSDGDDAVRRYQRHLRLAGLLV